MASSSGEWFDPDVDALFLTAAKAVAALKLAQASRKHAEEDPCATDQGCFLYAGCADDGDYLHICSDCNVGDIQPFKCFYKKPCHIRRRAKLHEDTFHVLLRNRDEFGIALPPNTHKRGFPFVASLGFRASHLSARPSQPPSRQTTQPSSRPSTPLSQRPSWQTTQTLKTTTGATLTPAPLPQPASWPTTTQPPWSLSRPPVMIDVSGVEDEQCLSVRRDERPPMDSGSGRERDSSSRVSLGDLQQYLQQQAQQRQEWGGLMQQMQQQFQQQQQAAEDITATVLAAAESATAAAASATTAATSAGTFAAAATSAAAASAQLFGADTIGRALQVVGGQFRVASGTRPTALFFCASGWPTDLYRRLLPSLGHMAKERQPGEEPSLDWQGWKLAGYPADGTPFVANALQLLSESSPGFTEAFTSQFEGLGAPPLTIHGLAAPGTDGGYNHKAQVDKLITKMRAILKTRPNTQLIVVGYVPLPALSLDSSLCLTCPCPCLTKCPFAGWRRSPASSPTSWPSTIAEAATSTGPPLPEMYLLLGLSSPTRRC